MNLLDGFGMDTITMAGSLEAKLSAMKEAGFSQVMLMARDLVTHPGGVPAAVAAVQAAARTGWLTLNTCLISASYLTSNALASCPKAS